MSIGERITELRKQKNISQLQLARALDVSRQAVSKWENDLASPDTLKMIHLADFLGTDTEYLMTGRHCVLKEPPTVVTIVQKAERTEPQIIEKIVEVEKIIEVERVVEKIIEVPRYKKVIRIKYLRNPLEFALIGMIGLAIGILIGILI